MNKLALLLTACALFTPALAREPRPQAEKTVTKKVAAHKPVALRAHHKKAQPAKSPEADLRRIDYPWETPS